ncbi:adenosylcobinamide amidohydrolase (plasmid) [Agrobacterium tumefaciens]|uniref:adenosylcobinamide amidohydrolase n=2 Tax=Agrobacterium tumefaciens TaxID=358 RepID=UPI0015724473|nr:adenosylcobinamide amidohydrolase [Agrobacterium tumefaciens]NSZ66212.1 hypothetical protein [Agrobacterium tumefaciens]NTA72584.1 hypothetical protein [Agrobacterium tumefaciens]WIE41820.1 adenosylcobinamide amidohydrolase [Agrobacterium tumefaciens]
MECILDLFARSLPDTTWPMKASEVLCVDKILRIRFAAEQLVLSWSLTRPGFFCADTAAWREASDADLAIDVDPAVLIRAGLTWADYGEDVRLMTLRDVGKNHRAKRQCGDAIAFCLATVDLANAGRVGADTPHLGQSGTINLVAQLNQPLNEARLIEALSIAAEASTAAAMDIDWTRDGLFINGTGAHCIAVACPVGGRRQSFAGLHTEAGQAIGVAVDDNVLPGGRAWVAEKTCTSQGSQER